MTYVICLVYLVLYITVSWFMGALVRILSGMREEKSLVSYFFNVLIGSFLIVLLYAVMQSHGKTVLLLIVVPALHFLFSKWKEAPGQWKELLSFPFKWWMLSAVVGAAVLALLHLLFESTTMQQDSANYLKMAEALRISGQENTRHFRSVFSPDYTGIEPYHYYEMWLGAFFMEISKGAVTHFQLFRSVTYGFILVMCVLGMTAITEVIIGKVKTTAVVIAFAFLFFVPNVAQLVFNYEGHFGYHIESNPLNRLNFRTYWMFLMPVFIFLLRKENLKACIALLCLPVISVTAAPVTFGTIAILILANRWLHFLTRQETGRVMMVYGSFLVGFVVLFKMCGMKHIPSLYSFTPAQIMGYYKMTWKGMAHQVVLDVLNWIIVFAPWLILIFMNGKTGSGIKNWKTNHIVLLILSMLIAGSLFFQATSFMNNAYQFRFIAFCAANIGIFILFHHQLALVNGNTKRIIYQIVFCLIILFTGYEFAGLSRQSLFVGQENYHKNYRRYSNTYLAEVKNAMNGVGDHPGAFIGDSTYYRDLYYSKRLPDFYFPGISYFIFSQFDNAYQFCLSDTTAILYKYKGTSRDLGFIQRSVSSALFYHEYYNGETGSVGQKQLEMIDRYHIAYLILTPGVSPSEEWKGRVKKSWKDNSTGEQFLLLQ